MDRSFTSLISRFVWLMFALIVFQASGQSTFEKYSTEDGLANSVVYRICKDKKGFLWATTDYGVSCFDGKK